MKTLLPTIFLAVLAVGCSAEATPEAVIEEFPNKELTERIEPTADITPEAAVDALTQTEPRVPVY